MTAAAAGGGAMDGARDTTTVYDIERLKEIIRPLAEDHGMRWAAVFGFHTAAAGGPGALSSQAR